MPKLTSSEEATDSWNQRMDLPTYPNTQRAMRWLLVFGWGLPLIAYGCVVLLTPDDAYNSFVMIKKLSDFVQGLVFSMSPMLDIYAHANSTAFVGVAKIASAFGFICAAWIASFTFLFTVVLFGHLEDSVNPVKRSDGFTKKQLFGGATWIPLLGIALMLTFYCMKGDPSFGRGFTTGHLLGYFLISAIAIVFAGVGIGFSFFSATVLFRRLFNKG